MPFSRRSPNVIWEQATSLIHYIVLPNFPPQKCDPSHEGSAFALFLGQAHPTNQSEITSWFCLPFYRLCDHYRWTDVWTDRMNCMINCSTRSIWKMLDPFATVSRFTLPFTRCRHCRTPPAHRFPRQQRQHVTDGTTMAPWNGPNHCWSVETGHSHFILQSDVA